MSPSETSSDHHALSSSLSVASDDTNSSLHYQSNVDVSRIPGLLRVEAGDRAQHKWIDSSLVITNPYHPMGRHRELPTEHESLRRVGSIRAGPALEHVFQHGLVGLGQHPRLLQPLHTQ